MKTRTKNLLKYTIIVGSVLIFSRFVLFRNKVNTVPVRKIDIQNRVIEKTISVSGEVIADKSASLTFNSSAGEVSNVYVSEGDIVNRGDLLAALNTQANSYTLQSYKDARDVALKDVEIYIDTYGDDTDVVGGNSEYRLNVNRLEELASKAEASYQAQLSLYRNSYIYAPFDGVVIDVTKDPGDSAISYETIVKLADVAHYHFEVELDQEDFGLIKKGQKVEITLDPYSDKTFTGTINELPQYANGGATPNFLVEVTFDPNQEGILLGMTGDANIIAETTENEVPSLLYDEVNFDEEEKPYVWVVRNKTLKKEYIEIGLEGDIFTEIKSELSEDIYAPVGDIKLEEGFRAAIQ